MGLCTDCGVLFPKLTVSICKKCEALATVTSDEERKAIEVSVLVMSHNIL